MARIITSSIKAVEDALSRPALRTLMIAYLLAAVWLTPAAGETGQNIQIGLATVLIAVAMADNVVAFWGKQRRLLAIALVPAAGLFWFATVGGWLL